VLSQKPGVLVVSETAGVASEVGESALLVSPLDVEGTAQALATAIAMPQAERTARIERLKSTIAAWTARDWLAAQLRELNLELATRTPAPVPRAVASTDQAGVVERELIVLNPHGLHARPAAAWVRCARGYTSTIEIVREGKSFSAQSIFGVLSAHLNQGSTFTLRASGPDAAAAVETLADLLSEFEAQGM
jgi:phosphotransferase system HPr (HPr) family protein